MAKPRAILNRVKSIGNIAKITRTMQMIATARFKRAFDRAVASRPYTDRITRLIGELSSAAGDFRHPLLEVREPKRAAVLAVASNRGLCGGYNANVVKTTVSFLAEIEARDLPFELHIAGKRLGSMLRFRGVEATSLHTHFEDRPRYDETNVLASAYLDAYAAGELDEVHVIYTKFLSAARQQAVVEQVLPLRRPEGGGEAAQDYIFSPDPAEILSDLLPKSVRLHLFQSFLDAAVSEQTARMVAMKAATDNAQEMIRDLTQLYNRSRQAQITTELSEIMGGAAALE